MRRFDNQVRPQGRPCRKGGDESNWAIARSFFVTAVLVVVIDALWLRRNARFPNSFAVGALCLAILGLGLLPLSHQAEIGRARLRLPRGPTWALLAVFVTFFAFYSATGSLDATGFNEPVQQAYAFLHGRAWVEAPPYMEHVTWRGHTYLVHPPLSAILLMPIVAIQGLSTNQTAISIVLGAVEVALAWRLLGLLGLTTKARVWLTVFFGAGTTLWYEVIVGNSWDFILVISCGMTLVVLNEVFGRARPWMTGLLAGLAGLARYDLALVWPIYILMLRVRGRRWRELGWIAPGFVFAMIIYVVFNETRYGTVSDISLWIYYPTDPHRFSHPRGPFSLSYLPENIYTLLFMSPLFNDSFPYIHPSMTGQSVLLITPAFLLALRPSFRRPIPALIGLAALIASGPPMLVYANGFVQLGTRYYTEVYPLLLVLIALGVPPRVDQLTRILIVASMVLVAFGVWHVRTMGFG